MPDAKGDSGLVLSFVTFLLTFPRSPRRWLSSALARPAPDGEGSDLPPEPALDPRLFTYLVAAVGLASLVELAAGNAGGAADTSGPVRFVTSFSGADLPVLAFLATVLLALLVHLPALLAAWLDHLDDGRRLSSLRASLGKAVELGQAKGAEPQARERGRKAAEALANLPQTMPPWAAASVKDTANACMAVGAFVIPVAALTHSVLRLAVAHGGPVALGLAAAAFAAPFLLGLFVHLPLALAAAHRASNNSMIVMVVALVLVPSLVAG